MPRKGPSGPGRHRFRFLPAPFYHPTLHVRGPSRDPPAGMGGAALHRLRLRARRALGALPVARARRAPHRGGVLRARPGERDCARAPVRAHPLARGHRRWPAPRLGRLPGRAVPLALRGLPRAHQRLAPRAARAHPLAVGDAGRGARRLLRAGLRAPEHGAVARARPAPQGLRSAGQGPLPLGEHPRPGAHPARVDAAAVDPLRLRLHGRGDRQPHRPGPRRVAPRRRSRPLLGARSARSDPRAPPPAALRVVRLRLQLLRAALSAGVRRGADVRGEARAPGDRVAVGAALLVAYVCTRSFR